jgi:acyl carrier protein
MATSSTVQLEIARLLSAILRVPASEVTPEKSFEGDLGARSATMTMLLTQLEDVFDVEIPYMQVRRAKTVGAAAALIAELTEE